jgi:signal transduction histidine kinase/DNA-binding response OmpR family regulator/ligand-binding sensor domain-containing protein
MMQDRSGTIWLAASKDGVVRVDVPAQSDPGDLTRLVKSIRFKKMSIGPSVTYAFDLCERKDGKILVASDPGLLVIDPKSDSVSRPRFTDSHGIRLDTVLLYNVVQDREGKLWMSSWSSGLFRLDWENGSLVNYRHRSGDSLSIRSDEIWEMSADPQGNLWVGTKEGIDLFSPLTGQCIPYSTFEEPFRGSDCLRFSTDCTGTQWLATGSSVYWLSPHSQRLPHFSLPERGGWRKLNQSRLVSFQAIERGTDGSLWSLSEGKALQLDKTAHDILKEIHLFDWKQGKRLGSGPGCSMVDGKGNLWYAAADRGLYKINLSTKRISNYHDPGSRYGKGDNILQVARGTGDTLLIGGFYQGVKKFYPPTGKFLGPWIDDEDNNGIMRDHKGKIWLSQIFDLLTYDPATGTTERFTNIQSDPRSLSHSLSWSAYEDPSGRVWVGAGNVINLWDPSTRSFTRFSGPGLTDCAEVRPIGMDQIGRLWVSTDLGRIAILDTASGEFTIVDNSMGLCGSVTGMENLDDGRVVLSGWAGLNIVWPDSVVQKRHAPPLVITRMSVNDIPMAVSPTLWKDFLRLSYMQDVLEFDFAAIDIDAPHLVRYQYRLEGLEKDWVKPVDRRFVRYTALSPGEFIFRVKATSMWDEWPEQEISLAFSIAPPWWKTTWAYVAYVFLLIGVLSAGYRVRLRQVRLQQEVEMEHFQRERLAEVDRLKSRFFANISHEFRTPLTLILGPIAKWKERSHSEERSDEESELPAKEQILPPRFTRGQNDRSHRELYDDMSMVERNAHRLLRLINQLLDLSKLEAGAIKLRASRMNIVPLVRGIAYSFESSAGIRGVDLDVRVEQEDIEVYCDRDMVEKILSNLLSNAFKFTAEGGKVTVTVTQFRIQISELRTQNSIPPSFHRGGIVGGRGGEFVEIAVRDTGIGIPPDQLEKVFDRFYQVDASQTREHEGSGIGLALVKELVELHHGTILVQSEVGKGTTFTVRLPLGRGHLTDDEIVEASEIVEPTSREMDAAHIGLGPGKLTEESEHVKAEKPIVLVIEDNADVRTYVKGYLVPAYQVAEAGDGAEGIEKAREVIPDLVISDVMMPKKDGYEVCRTLKLDERTSHIPIILLTAKAASENKIEGLEIGADDYLIKPFEPKELLARVKNLIELRRKLRERFRASVPLRPGEIAVTSMDDAFLKKVMAAVEQHIGDESFHADELAAKVGMSGRQLLRKLTALTNQGPAELIRYVRLHRAMELLEKGAGTVSEIAYMVGFNDPSYFSRCFHQQFGKVPTEVRKSSALAENSAKKDINPS